MSVTVSKPPRMLIVWGWLPCNHSGAGILMRRLFADFPSDRLWALTSRHSARTLASHNPVPSPEKHTAVPEIQIHRRWFDKIARILNFLLIPWTVWRGVRLVHKQQIEAVFAVPFDHFTIAAYLIHAITGASIFMYAMDDPAGAQRLDGTQPLLYRVFMPRLMRACKRIWGVSDGMCNHFSRAYAVSCSPLLPSLDLEGFEKQIVPSPNVASDYFDIVFTGSIYSAQLDAVRRLVHVVNEESKEGKGQKTDMRLTLYTFTPVAALERMGLTGKRIRTGHIEYEGIASVLSKADVAFLPLSFEPEMRHVVETSFPSKIAEYLAAGVPLLVHAPIYSTVAQYCRENGCGVVVDEPNEGLLHDALTRLRSDAALRRELSTKALETAREKHDAKQIVSQFMENIR